MIEKDELISRLCHLVAVGSVRETESLLDNTIRLIFAIEAKESVNSIPQVREALSVFFEVNRTEGEIRESIKRLSVANELEFDEATDLFEVSKETKLVGNERINEAKLLESSVRDEWWAHLQSLELSKLPSLDDLWTSLFGFLTSVFKRHGARTLLVLGIHDEELQEAAFSDTELTSLMPCSNGMDESKFRNIIKSFFDFPSENRGKFLNQLLKTTFSLRVLHHDKEVAGFLRENLPNLTFFVDTNFLFGVLGFPDNQFNELSHELIRSVKDNNLPFEFRFHEDTLRELKESLKKASKPLSQKSFSQGLSKAILKSRPSKMSGIELKYHEANSICKTDAESFFLKFNHAERLLQDDHGFVFHRRETPFDEVKYNNETLGLMSKFRGFLNDHPTKPTERRIEAIRHDIELWLAVKRRQKSGVSSLDVGALLLTADRRLFEYDRRILNANRETGVVIMPDQLIQILRPFISDNSDFDRNFAEMVALPEFRALDADFSKASEKAIAIMAQFSNMSEETALHILGDDFLQRKLNESENDGKAIELIESSALKHNESLLIQKQQDQRQLQIALEEARKTKQISGHRKSLITEKDSAIQNLKNQQAKVTQELESIRIEIKSLSDHSDIQQQALADHERGKEALEQENAALQNEIELKNIAANKSDRLIRCIGLVAFPILVAYILIQTKILESWDWFNSHEHRHGICLALILMVAGLSWAIFGWKKKFLGIVAIIFPVVIELLSII